MAWNGMNAPYQAQGQMPGDGQIWKVVGGSEGGIVVRRGRKLESEALKFKLHYGARVEEMDLIGDRLHYKRLSGDGPDYGWVSLTCKGLKLLRKVSEEEANLLVMAHIIDMPNVHAKTPNSAPADRGMRCFALTNMPDMPDESKDWSALERSLWLHSYGNYAPVEMAKKRLGELCPERVSVVVPTTDARQEFHEQVWACFQAQDWPDKELIVVETYKQRQRCSWIFASKASNPENRVVHQCFQGHMTIGFKRNIGVHLASGGYIVHFDDDDLYAPNYIRTMVEDLRERDLAANTLSTWYNYNLRENKFGFVDPENFPENHDDEVPLVRPRAQGEAEPERQLPPVKYDKNGRVIDVRKIRIDHIVYGYGFSYCYRRQAADEVPFPDVSMSEDYYFMMGVREKFGSGSVGLLRDPGGICLHFQHSANTAQSNDDREVTLDEVRQLAVCGPGLEVLQPQLRWVLASLSPSQEAMTRDEALHVLRRVSREVKDPRVQKRLGELQNEENAGGMDCRLHGTWYDQFGRIINIVGHHIVWQFGNKTEFIKLANGDLQTKRDGKTYTAQFKTLPTPTLTWSDECVWTRKEYRTFVAEHLQATVYPSICGELGLPRDVSGVRLLFEVMEMHFREDEEILEQYRNLQVLLGNDAVASRTERQIRQVAAAKASAGA